MKPELKKEILNVIKMVDNQKISTYEAADEIERLIDNNHNG